MASTHCEETILGNLNFMEAVLVLAEWESSLSQLAPNDPAYLETERRRDGEVVKLAAVVDDYCQRRIAAAVRKEAARV